MFSGECFIHQDTDGNCQRLGTDVPGHVKHKGLETDYDRKYSHNMLKDTYNRGNDHPKEQQDDEPWETFFHALCRGFFEIFFGGEAGQFCVIFPHLIVNHLYDIFGCNNTEHMTVLRQDRNGIFRIIHDFFHAVINFFVIGYRWIGADDNIVKHIMFSCNNKIFQINSTGKFQGFIQYING